MSLWSRLFKPKGIAVDPGPYQKLVETTGLLLLAAREKRDDSLRRSARFGELLGLLWQDDKRAVKAVHAAFSSVEKLDREFVAELARRLRAALTAPPATPEARYEAVVRELHAQIEAVSLVPGGILTQEAALPLINGVTLARILIPPELHDPLCKFLVAYNHACGLLGLDSPVLQNRASQAYQPQIRDNIHRFLASIDPDAMPYFWEMLRDETHSEEFWPVLRRIQDIRAVPYLLELLPNPEDVSGRSSLRIMGQKEIIQALRMMGDLRAVAVLLAIEKRPLPALPPVGSTDVRSPWDQFVIASWEQLSELARLAGQAARHILRNSDASEAQLLRASDRPATPKESLLRPSGPAVGTAPSGELLRPSVENERTNQAL